MNDIFQPTKIITSVKCVEENHGIGSRDGAVVWTLSSHQCGKGLIPAQYGMWVECAVGSHLALKVFLQVFPFSTIHKNQYVQIPIIRPG